MTSTPVKQLYHEKYGYNSKFQLYTISYFSFHAHCSYNIVFYLQYDISRNVYENVLCDMVGIFSSS